MEVVRTKFVREMLANREVVFERQRLQHLSKVKVSGIKNERDGRFIGMCARDVMKATVAKISYKHTHTYTYLFKTLLLPWETEAPSEAS